jgi:hypothetical protein
VDELELDGVDEDELDDDVLEVLGVVELDELDELPGFGAVPSGPVGLPFAQPMVAASPMVSAPPLRRRRKSRRSASAFRASFSSIFRSLWLAMTAG